MSVSMKKPHTNRKANIVWHGSKYRIPLDIIAKYKVIDEERTVSVDELFSDLIEEHTEPGLLLKGLRAKEGLSQIEFSRIIGVTQANLSAMENGRRYIGKEMAKRIAAAFGINYRLFL